MNTTANELQIIKSRKAYLALSRSEHVANAAKRFALYFTTTKGLYACLSYDTLEEIADLVAEGKAFPGVRSVFVRELVGGKYQPQMAL